MSGRKLAHLQDNSGDRLQVQALLETAERLRTQGHVRFRRQTEKKPEEEWTTGREGWETV